MISIGDLAAQAGVSTRALRYYEQQGLLSAARSGGGQRRYPDSATDRVRLIRDLYAAGLPSRAVAVVLPCVDARVSTEELTTLLHAERARIKQQISDLTESLTRLDDVITIATVPGACRD